MIKFSENEQNCLGMMKPKIYPQETQYLGYEEREESIILLIKLCLNLKSNVKVCKTIFVPRRDQTKKKLSISCLQVLFRLCISFEIT